jgi:amino acid transporter
MFAVANTALINMMMASRLLYGMARQDVLPRSLGKVLPNRRSPWASIIFTTLIAVALIITVTNFMGPDTVSALGGTTALLLLCVFTVVNVAVLVLRRRPIDRRHFRSPTILPYLGVLTCAFLVGPWAQDPIEYQIAGVMIGLGVVLWALTWLWNRGVRAKKTRIRHPEDLAG